MKKQVLAIAALIAFGAAHADNTVSQGDNGTSTAMNIGDTDNSKASSASMQINPSSNQNGNSLGNTVDTRTQINPNIITSPTATGGQANGNQSSNANNSAAYNGPQSMGQANTGNSSVGNVGSSSGGNILGGSSSGGNSLTNGSNTANNAAAGGAGGNGGAGGQGGTASSNGTNLGINGQQQGIDKSGNSSNANSTKTSTAQGQGQQQANTGTNAQGQTSANRNSTGGNSQSTTAGNGAGASAGAGAGANNRTSNTTRVDASDRSATVNSYVSKAVAWAPIIPGPVAAPLASANLVVIPGQCGPRVRLVATNVTGKQFGPFGGQYDIAQGQDIDTTMAQGADGQYEPYIVIGDDVWGQRVDRAIGALGTSSATNFSIGGFTSKGDAAQGGAGGSGSLQQIVARSFVTDCVIGKVIKPAPVVIVEQAVIHRPARQDRN